MFKRLSPGLLFSMAALAAALLTPLVVLFYPIFHVQTFLYDASAFVLFPSGINFMLVSIACVVVILFCILLAYKRNVLTYIASVLLIGGSIGMLYMATLSYVKINDEQIVQQHLFDEQIVRWDDVNEVVLEYVIGDVGEYIFTANDGKQIIIPETGQFNSEAKSKIYQLTSQYNVRFIEREK
ncbi:acyl dehydratase [Lysinibacillus sp. 2017]|uniref:acyl dehydratase n=1 Tax=unclassified Lysinibacillus TaxID=2636778 RepID=UPI000D5257B1|nr:MULTISPECIES: acyl dehydratase [unclassified Lysinibacillus]AWE08704.1 acyl dehydratase [Lysinibacillus sp. 2017]TGN35125.1 acyl dehydratase [Lysinibacillus sp. S2017]